MNRLLRLAVVTVATAVATRAARRYLAGNSTRSRVGRSTSRRPIETWENEGGNLPPEETRSLQQQLG